MVLRAGAASNPPGMKKDATGPHQEPNLTFVISTYNRRALLETETDRIRDMTQHARVIIVDDGSDDDTESFLRSTLGNDDRVEVIRNATNTGSAHCWNVGLLNARSRFVFLLHDDSLELLPTVEDFVRTLTASLARYDIVGVHVSEFEPFHIRSQGIIRDVLYSMLYALAGQVISRNYGRRKETWFVSGILGVKTQVGRSLLFDDALLTGNGYREESDFELRARRQGFRTIYEPRISVVHKSNRGGGQSTKAAGQRYAFWAIRNQFIFMRKNHLRLWAVRLPLFALYQMIMHRASPGTVARGLRAGLLAMQSVPQTGDGKRLQ